jgi:hypothetical protein
MNPRHESGYDPMGDPRTGRPPLPQDRERMRQREPEEMDYSGSTGQSLRDAGEEASARVSEAAASAMQQGSDLAAAASDQIQAYSEDFLSFARRRPLPALLGAVAIGLLIGLLSRGRG